MSTELESKSPAVPRLVAIDAYRGLAMTLMMAEVLQLRGVARARPAGTFWAFLAHHQEHVAWVGCSLHDLIQPSFSMLVGVALPFSIASRLARGESRGAMAMHAIVRAAILVFLGIFLRSVGRDRTNFTFEDTLTQIGLGYPILVWLGLRPSRDRWIALIMLIVGYWAAFALYPAPGAGFDFAGVGVPGDWPHHMKGFRAHWDKNSNLAWAFDRWFLNLFPRSKPFTHNGGGYATLSFLPTLATMIIGLLAGDLLRGPRSTWGKVGVIFAAGLVSLGAGWAAGELGICPVVKRIWTPSWALFSGGLCLLALASFLATTDAIRPPGWAFPLRVVGMNSIAAYVIAHLAEDFIADNVRTHLGAGVYRGFGPDFEPLVRGGVVLLIFWLILLWMYRRKIFLRV